jgi:hypothetical protein
VRQFSLPAVSNVPIWLSVEHSVNSRGSLNLNALSGVAYEKLGAIFLSRLHPHLHPRQQLPNVWPVRRNRSVEVADILSFPTTENFGPE